MLSRYFRPRSVALTGGVPAAALLLWIPSALAGECMLAVSTRIPPFTGVLPEAIEVQFEITEIGGVGGISFSTGTLSDDLKERIEEFLSRSRYKRDCFGRSTELVIKFRWHPDPLSRRARFRFSARQEIEFALPRDLPFVFVDTYPHYPSWALQKIERELWLLKSKSNKSKQAR
jgi:hypothetical protein